MSAYKKIAGIYMILSSIDKKTYIGYSEIIRKRWDSHKHHLRRNLHSNQHLQNAWNKYGETNFTFSFLEIMPSGLTKTEYEAVETKWVLHFKSCEKEYGYNKCIPGSIPLKGPNLNKTGRRESLYIKVVCINSYTREIVITNSFKEASSLTEAPLKKISEYCSYWTKPLQKTHRSYKGWLMIKEVEYDSSVDYTLFKKPYKVYNTKNNQLHL